MGGKLRVGLIFGGRSAEHEVSIRSARSIAAALDPERYEVIPIAIDRTGVWHLEDAQRYLAADAVFPLAVSTKLGELVPSISNKDRGLFDVVFPVTHGTYGEDGTLQGLLRLANIPFVGPSVLGSAVGMDKDVMKRLLREAGVAVARFRTISRRGKDRYNFRALVQELGSSILFVKPANSGSSIGISRVSMEADFEPALEEAFLYDTKVIVEEGIVGREIEISVLGNEEPIASVPGEIRARDGFYDYAAKYIDDDGAQLFIPAELDPEISIKCQKLAIKTFQVLCCEGMARVDLFLKSDGQLLVNEINTLPGFTSISMYPKLWECSAMPYSKLLDRLIELAIERHQRDSQLKISP